MKSQRTVELIIGFSLQEMMEYKARGCKPLEEVNNAGGMMAGDVGMGGDDHDDDDDGDDE